MKKNRLIWLIMGASIALVMACGGSESTAAVTPTEVPTKVAETSSVTTTSSSTIADITIVMEEVPAMAYVPANITMEAGKTYNIKLVGGTEFHTWTIVDSSGGYVENFSINPSTEDIIQLTAPVSGTYDIICLPHQVNNMIGKLVVD
jgi:plastocyanin